MSSSVTLPRPPKAQDFQALSRAQDELDNRNATKSLASTLVTKEASGPFTKDELLVWNIGNEGGLERAQEAIKTKTGLREIPQQISALLKNLTRLSGDALNKGLTTLLSLLNSNQEVARALQQKLATAQ